MARSEALLEAGLSRLRPILMTSATTVLGLLPMALGLGEGAELRAPLAITVIGGLAVATAPDPGGDPGGLHPGRRKRRRRLSAVPASPPSRARPALPGPEEA
jgi:hypothetical protein